MVGGESRRGDGERQQCIGHTGGIEADHGLAVHSVSGEQLVAEYRQGGTISALVHSISHRGEGAVLLLIDSQVLCRGTVRCGQQKGGICTKSKPGFVGGLIQTGQLCPTVAIQLLYHRGIAAQNSHKSAAAGGQVIGGSAARAGQPGESAILRLIDQKIVVVGHIPEGQIYLALPGHGSLRAAEHPAGGAEALTADAAAGDGGIACLRIAAGHVGQVQCAALRSDGVVIHVRQAAQRLPGTVRQYGQIQRTVAGTPGNHRSIAQTGQCHPVKAARLGERLFSHGGPARIGERVKTQLVTGVGQGVPGGHDLASDRALGQRHAGVFGKLSVLPEGLRVGLGDSDREGHAPALGRGNIRDHDAGICAVRKGERALGQPGAGVRAADGGAATLGGKKGVAHGGPLAALHVAVLARLGAEHIHAGGAEVVA